jgi:adenosine deaminase
LSVSLAFVRALPKAEVHVHLEGCFLPSELTGAGVAADAGAGGAADAGAGPDVAGGAGHGGRPLFEDLSAFLAALDRACASMATAEQVAGLARRFALMEAECGVGYADLIVNPSHWTAWRGRLGGLVDAIDGGLREAESDGAPPVGLCPSLSRTASSSEARQLVEAVLSLRHPRVVGLSIDGDERSAGRTGPRFAEAFRLAAAGGLRRTVHAGESSGPEGVRDALDLLGADRIDHGVRAVEDAALVGELAAREVPLGVCPHSNVVLGLYRNRAEHPVDVLRRAGVRVSINTDDPVLLGCRLDEEYVATAETFGWDETVVRAVARTSIESSFANEDVKAALLGELDARPNAPPR